MAGINFFIHEFHGKNRHLVTKYDLFQVWSTFLLNNLYFVTFFYDFGEISSLTYFEMNFILITNLD